MFDGPRYSKEDYARNKTILFHRHLDGSTVRIEIPGMGQDVDEMLQQFKAFMEAMTYSIGEFRHVTRDELAEEEREYREMRAAKYRDDYEEEEALDSEKPAGEPVPTCLTNCGCSKRGV